MNKIYRQWIDQHQDRAWSLSRYLLQDVIARPHEPYRSLVVLRDVQQHSYEEAVFLNIIGEIDPEKLGQVMEQLNVNVDLE